MSQVRASAETRSQGVRRSAFDTFDEMTWLSGVRGVLSRALGRAQAPQEVLTAHSPHTPLRLESDGSDAELPPEDPTAKARMKMTAAAMRELMELGGIEDADTHAPVSVDGFAERVWRMEEHSEPQTSSSLLSAFQVGTDGPVDFEALLRFRADRAETGRTRPLIEVMPDARSPRPVDGQIGEEMEDESEEESDESEEESDESDESEGASEESEREEMDESEEDSEEDGSTDEAEQDRERSAPCASAKFTTAPVKQGSICQEGASSFWAPSHVQEEPLMEPTALQAHAHESHFSGQAGSRQDAPIVVLSDSDSEPTDEVSRTVDMDNAYARELGAVLAMATRYPESSYEAMEEDWDRRGDDQEEDQEGEEAENQEDEEEESDEEWQEQVEDEGQFDVFDQRGDDGHADEAEQNDNNSQIHNDKNEHIENVEEPVVLEPVECPEDPKNELVQKSGDLVEVPTKVSGSGPEEDHKETVEECEKLEDPAKESSDESEEELGVAAKESKELEESAKEPDELEDSDKASEESAEESELEKKVSSDVPEEEPGVAAKESEELEEPAKESSDVPEEEPGVAAKESEELEEPDEVSEELENSATKPAEEFKQVAEKGSENASQKLGEEPEVPVEKPGEETLAKKEDPFKEKEDILENEAHNSGDVKLFDPEPKDLETSMDEVYERYDPVRSAGERSDKALPSRPEPANAMDDCTSEPASHPPRGATDSPDAPVPRFEPPDMMSEREPSPGEPGPSETTRQTDAQPAPHPPRNISVSPTPTKSHIGAPAREQVADHMEKLRPPLHEDMNDSSLSTLDSDLSLPTSLLDSPHTTRSHCPLQRVTLTRAVGAPTFLVRSCTLNPSVLDEEAAESEEVLFDSLEMRRLDADALPEDVYHSLCRIVGTSLLSDVYVLPGSLGDHWMEQDSRQESTERPEAHRLPKRARQSPSPPRRMRLRTAQERRRPRMYSPDL